MPSPLQITFSNSGYMTHKHYVLQQGTDMLSLLGVTLRSIWHIDVPFKPCQSQFVVPFTLIAGQKSVSGTPLGSPSNTRRMIEFCARHQIAPVIETFPMSRANEASEHLKARKSSLSDCSRERFGIILQNVRILITGETTAL